MSNKDKIHASHLRIEWGEPLITPRKVKEQQPITQTAYDTVRRAREECRNGIAGKDDRLLVVVGPCSIHDPKGAIEYAEKLASLKKKTESKMILIMRVYFEKPRTILGWKGLINDPHLNNTFNIEEGLKIARKLLLDINELGVPCATEFLDPFVPAYLSDLISWCAIGARTTESQTHREMASGLSMPVGFKNSTSGDVAVALHAMESAASPHTFLGIDQDGLATKLRTTGNQDTHIILRGSLSGANCSVEDLSETALMMNKKGPKRQIMVDCSHGNTNGKYIEQLNVFEQTLDYYKQQPDDILGMMLESNLYGGKQPFGGELKYGVSITDPCIGWEDTEKLLLS